MKACRIIVGRGGRRRGQGLVELTFVIIMLLALTFGLIQYGMLYNAALALNNLTRESARFAAVNARGKTKSQLKISVVDRIRERANGTPIDESDMSADKITMEFYAVTTDGVTNTSTLTPSDTPQAGQPVTVTINYDLKANHAFVPVYIPQRWVNYKATASNLVE